MKRPKRILAILTVLAMVVTSVPNTFWATAYAAESGSSSTDTRVADNTTLDGWKQYFGENNKAFNTQYAGHVWTDKSVTTDASVFNYATELADRGDKITINSEDANNFLVSLSAMASSKSVTGQDNKPTDTMIVLDMSSSMYKNSTVRDPGPITAMINSVNSTIKQLQELNVNNRVGVTIYYGGPDLNQAAKDSYQVWLPLDRYKQKDNKFLVAKTSSGKLSSAGVNSDVTTEAGKAVKATTRATNVTAGTYMQQGILSALKQFMAADTKVPETAAVNAGETRIPVMVLMSDGKPTAATNLYTQLDRAAIMGSNREDIRSADQTDFLTQLTASYAKAMMDAHYKEETPLLYTLSFGNSFSYTVMDPSGTLEKKNTEHESNPATVSGYWNKLVANNSMTLSYKVSKGQWDANTTNKTCTVSKATVDGKAFPSSASQQYYVDKAFEAATADDLEDAFANIFTDITLQTHTYPTLVEGDENLDGYISFVDKIGEYMSVTDVKGVLLGDHWYSGKEFAKNLSTLGDMANPTPLGDELVWSIQQRLGLPDSATVRTLLNLAYQHGQLAYNSDGSYSNYVGWYSDAQGNYLGFWQDGVTTAPDKATHANKSYIYLGETDASHGVKDSDMMYTTVRLRQEIKTGVESVSFAVPAALIPTVEYDVEYDENDDLESVTRGGADHPIRLVFEVALDDSINGHTIRDAVDHNYMAHNTDKDGYVNFYTNQYEVSGEVGYGKVNTYSYFRPSHQNENYYYQENEPVYIDQAGTVYKGSNEPDTNGVFYREITVYHNDNGTVREENIYRQLSTAALNTAVPKADGTWYIPKGNVHVNMDGYTIEKEANKTETLANANLPYVDVYGHHVNDTDHRFVIGDTLGNNGKVRIKAETGIKLTKEIANANSETNMDEEFEFTIATDASVTGAHDAVKVAADGTESETTVTFDSGNATVTLKHGESLYVLGLAPGLEFTVTETEEADFVVSKVVMDGFTIPETVATGTLGDGYIADVEFTNVPRGEGALTIAKQVVHPLGTYYQIPDDKTFTVNVKLEGVAVNNGSEFDVTHSGNADLKSVKGTSFDLTLKHGEQVEIKGIPEGTKATVTEPDPDVGFTVKYKENGADGDGVIESVQKAPTIDNVTVVNTYNPEPAEVKIDLSGVKTLVDENGKTVAKEDWGDLEFQFIIQKYVYENGAWKWVDTENIDVANSTDDEVDFVNDGRTLTFDKVGTYGYQVIEKNHGLTIDGITYDAEMHTFDVIVTDADMDGKLEATVKSSHGEGTLFVFEDGTWTNDQINFINSDNRKETSEVIMIKKALENASGSPNVSLEGYQFELFKSDAEYRTTGDKVLTTPATDASGETYVHLTYDYEEAGTYYYKLKEKATGINAMTDSDKVYNFKVVVTANNDGSVTSEIIEGTDTEFAEFASGAQGVTYDLAAFENVYKPTDAEVTLDVKKTLTNRTLKAGEFEFSLKQGNKEIQTATNDAAGKVAFDKLVFDKVGTYEYTVQETSQSGGGVTVDGTVYDVVITVTDNNGKLAAAVDVLTVPGTEMLFENDYQPPEIKVSLGGEKALSGRDMAGGEFTFVMAESDADGNIKNGGVQKKVTNRGNGTFTFGEMTYDAVGTHYFVVYEEVPQNTHGITYDTTEYLVTIDIGYDMDKGEFTVDKTISEIGGSVVSAIKFDNKYKADATTAVIKGIKALQGRNLEEEQFGFQLSQSDASWNKGDSIRVARNNAEGYFEFDFGEDYFKEAGTYYYIINEMQGSAAGYTYDSKEVGAVVTVTDDLLGKLHATVSYVDLSRADNGTVTESPTAAVVFNNDYTITGDAKVNLNGTKSLIGRELAAGEFTFVLTDVTDKENPVEVATATNDADGKFGFELKYTAADAGNEYNYAITEKNAGETIDGVTYSTAEYEATVKVFDNGKGGIGTEVEVNADAIEFDNEYKTTDTDITLTAGKQLTGRDLEKGEFEFQLKDAEGKVLQTVKNDADGNIKFDKITYKASGTHTYTISEVPGSLGGVTYDTDVITVTVEVTDNGKGALVAKIADKDVSGSVVNAGTFENIYETSGEFDLTIKKNFTGRDNNNKWLDADFFEFEVIILDPATQAADDAGDIVFPHDGDDIVNLRIDANDADKEVTSPEIVINKAGTYKFRVHEVAGDIAGVTYDSVPYDIVVTAKDNGDGTLDVDWTAEGKETDADNKLVFDNVYDTTKTDISGHDNLVVDKQLVGRNWTDDDEFVFELAAADDATTAAIAKYDPDAQNKEGIVMPETTLAVTKDNMTRAHFGNITFYDKGTYRFTITEKASGIPGVTDDADNARTVVIKVEDNNAGGLVATKTSDSEALTFTNKYKPEPTKAVISGSKTLTGRGLAAGEFEFQLKDKDGNVLQSVKNTAATDGKSAAFSFGEISYDTVGTYEYTVNEVIPADKLGGVTYDNTLYSVTVKVTDNPATAKLEAAVSYETAAGAADLAAFENTYKAEPVEVKFEGDKVLTGRDMAEDEFEFQLKEGNNVLQTVKNAVAEDGAKAGFSFEKIKYDTVGTYEYTISEVIPADDEKLGGVTYDTTVKTVKVVVTDNGQGNLVAKVDEDNVSNSNVNVGTFENEYKPEPIEIVIDGGKQLGGRDMADGEFSIQLKAADGDVIETVPVTAGGDFTFTAIEYKTAGTYEYTVSEVQGSLANVEYDKNIFAVKVVITDNGDGTLSSQVTETVNGEPVDVIQFYNTYIPTPVEIDLAADKQLTGRDWFDSDEFVFRLAAEGDTKQAVKDGIVTITNDTVTVDKDNHKAVFENIKITKTGEYNFIITEKAGSISNITYDTHSLHVIVTVVDNPEYGKLQLKEAVSYIGKTEFINEFTPDPVTAEIEGTKVLTGRTLAADEFEFEIVGLKGAPMPGVTTVKNAADETVSFGAITYNQAGTFEYEIRETKGDMAGIIYDGSVIKAIVEVAYDKSTGLFSAEVSYEGATDENGFVFTNEYKTKPVSIKLDADKKVIASEGNAYGIKAGDFRFELAPADSNPDSDPVEKAVTAENDADGNIALGTLEFTEAGEYTYTVKEISSGIAGMGYDDTVYTITVKVTDNEAKAQLEAVTEITAEGKATADIVFENEYNPAVTSVNFDGMKVLESGHKDLEADEFTFQLKDADGKVVDTAVNSAAGTFQFDSITYDKVGTYEYTVSEVNDGKAGYTYDDTVYEITVVVTDENGALKAAVTGGSAEDIVFTNGYEPSPANLVIKGHKDLTGRDLNEGEFEFAVLDGEKEIAAAKNDKDGGFTFSAIDFKAAGTYNYTIVEKNTSVAGVTYDQIVYGVTVNVADENGTLKVKSADYLQNGKAVDSITFGNIYKPAPTSIQLGAAKVLEGRDLTEGEFKFVLEDESGNKLYAENTADGKIIFDEIKYDAAGIYTYKLYEESGDAEHMIYDETVYDITVTVNDDLAGNLKATIEGLDDGAVFKNTYVPEKEPTEPTKPEKPTDPEKPTQPPVEPTEPKDDTSDGGTQTGDDFNAGLYGFLALAALAVAGVAVRRRKEN